LQVSENITYITNQDTRKELLLFLLHWPSSPQIDCQISLQISFCMVEIYKERSFQERLSTSALQPFYVLQQHDGTQVAAKFLPTRMKKASVNR